MTVLVVVTLASCGVVAVRGATDVVARSARVRVAAAKPLTVTVTNPVPTKVPAPLVAAATPPAASPLAAAPPGPAQLVRTGPVTSNAVALSFDDGTCADCIGTIVNGVEATGAHITLCPNGVYASAWGQYAARIRAQIALGRVAICNHTFSHLDLTRLSDDQVRAQITTNEDWIQATFGVNPRPFLRPPYGAYNARVLAVAGSLGYSVMALWSAVLGDDTTGPQPDVGPVIDRAAGPGAIVLAHANREKTANGFYEMVSVISRKGLATATLPELFGAA